MSLLHSSGYPQQQQDSAIPGYEEESGLTLDLPRPGLLAPVLLTSVPWVFKTSTRFPYLLNVSDLPSFPSLEGILTPYFQLAIMKNGSNDL